MHTPLPPAHATCRLTPRLLAAALAGVALAGCRDTVSPADVSPPTAARLERAAASADASADSATPAGLTALDGTLVICNVAGGGVMPDAGFDFVYGNVAPPAAQSSVSVRAGAAPAGTCSAPIARRAGSVTITEIPGVVNAALSDVAVLPAGALEARLAQGARVTIYGGLTTTVTVTNASTRGALVICHVGGAGIAPGTPLDYEVSGVRSGSTERLDFGLVSVPAGPAPTGTCSEPITRDVGSVAVVERYTRYVAPEFMGVSPVSAIEGSAFGRVQVRIAGGQTTTVTFTNRDTRGTLVICNVAAGDVPLGTGFTYAVASPNAAPRVTSVAAGAGPAGTCAAPITYEVGTPGSQFTVTQQSAAGVLTSVAASPAGTLVRSVAGPGAEVMVRGGETTTVTFTNRSAYGALVICTVAGAGVPLGTDFWYYVSRGSAFTATRAPAGAGPAGTCSAPERFWPGDATVTLLPNAKGRFAAAVVSPASALGATMAGGAQVRIVAGQTTRVTVTVAGVAP